LLVVFFLWSLKFRRQNRPEQGQQEGKRQRQDARCGQANEDGQAPPRGAGEEEQELAQVTSRQQDSEEKG
jgi:hypothetical protein